MKKQIEKTLLVCDKKIIRYSLIFRVQIGLVYETDERQMVA